MFRRGRAGKCRLQFSLPRRYECVNCRIPLLGLRFAATSCRASHAYPCLFLLDTDTGNCTKTCPTIMHPPPLLHLPSTGGGEASILVTQQLVCWYKTFTLPRRKAGKVCGVLSIFQVLLDTGDSSRRLLYMLRMLRQGWTECFLFVGATCSRCSFCRIPYCQIQTLGNLAVSLQHEVSTPVPNSLCKGAPGFYI